MQNIFHSIFCQNSAKPVIYRWCRMLHRHTQRISRADADDKTTDESYCCGKTTWQADVQ